MGSAPRSRSRMAFTSAIVVMLVLGATVAVRAFGGHALPEPDPQGRDVVGYGEYDLPADDASSVSLGAPPKVQTDVASLPERLTPLVDALPNGARLVAFNGDVAVGWDAIYAELPSGDLIDASVQQLAHVPYPGSHIGPDWELVNVGRYEGAKEPRDASNTYESLWILTDHYQIGVSLAAPAGHRLATTPAASRALLEIFALDLAAHLE